MSAIALELPDLADFDYLSMVDAVEGDENTVEFHLYYYQYQDVSQELEHLSNAEFMLTRVKAADAGAGHVLVRYEREVRVTVRDASGAYTAAYVELIELLESMADYPILDDCDLQERKETYASNTADYYASEAEEIIDGGREAFEAHDMQCYLGDWDDIDLSDRDAAIEQLAHRLAYASLDND